MARRADREPSDDSTLCSCHFKDGKKENNPTIFSYLENKQFDFPSPEKKIKKVKRVSQNEDVPGPSGIQHRVDVAILQNENEIKKIKISSLELELAKKSLYFAFSMIKDNNDMILMYTGLPNSSVFYVILNYMKRLDFNYYYGWKVSSSLEDQLFITLQKLRLNYNFQDLAVRYSTSVTTIRNIFFTILHVLYESLYQFVFDDSKNLPSVHKVEQCSPIADDFPNCRFLFDCTEISIETPRNDMQAQRETYSSYKKAQTAKALIAVSPHGVICFCSDLFPGSYSDKMIVEKSGICDLLKPGDLIIADKGFLIRDLLPKRVLLNIPPFLMNPQFTEQEAKFTTQIARARTISCKYTVKSQ